jgi:hypothetical protein
MPQTRDQTATQHLLNDDSQTEGDEVGIEIRDKVFIDRYLRMLVPHKDAQEFPYQAEATAVFWGIILVFIVTPPLLKTPQSIIVFECSETLFFLFVSFIPQFTSASAAVVNRSVMAARVSFCGPPLVITVAGTCIGVICLFMMSKEDEQGGGFFDSSDADKKYSCQTPLGYCSTISCIAANIWYSGYVFMFVSITMNAGMSENKVWLFSYSCQQKKERK